MLLRPETKQQRWQGKDCLGKAFIFICVTYLFLARQSLPVLRLKDYCYGAAIRQSSTPAAESLEHHSCPQLQSRALPIHPKSLKAQ